MILLSSFYFVPCIPPPFFFLGALVYLFIIDKVSSPKRKKENENANE
jgi:hypothetical protein